MEDLLRGGGDLQLGYDPLTSLLAAVGHSGLSPEELRTERRVQVDDGIRKDEQGRFQSELARCNMVNLRREG